MPSISAKQIMSANAKMRNGWQLDVKYYVTHGEKQAIKRIRLDDHSFVEAALYMQEGRDKTHYGCSSGKYHVALHMNIYHERDNSPFATGYGLGQFVNVSTEEYPVRKFAAVQKMTANFKDEDVLKLLDPTKLKAGIY